MILPASICSHQLQPSEASSERSRHFDSWLIADDPHRLCVYLLLSTWVTDRCNFVSPPSLHRQTQPLAKSRRAQSAPAVSFDTQQRTECLCSYCQQDSQHPSSSSSAQRASASIASRAISLSIAPAGQQFQVWTVGQLKPCNRNTVTVTTSRHSSACQ
jgi:hypothetical protein